MKYVVATAVVVLCACSQSNNVFFGRVEAKVGTHTVVVTDCYRIHAPQPERLANGDYHYMPCRDAEVWIRRGEVTVNGVSYGQIADGDNVLVDHGVVSIIRGAGTHARRAGTHAGAWAASVEATPSASSSVGAST